MKPRFNFWLENEGNVAVSVWRVRLLTAVDGTGSISQAARQMDIPYRIAWQKIHEMEEQLGVKLVETQVGGKRGGGACLTPVGRRLVDKFARLAEDAEGFLESRYKEIFSD